MSFINRCLAGEATADGIDLEVEKWHTNADCQDQTLHEHLGMTWDEYKQWATRPSVLPSIISARLSGIPLAEELARAEQ